MELSREEIARITQFLSVDAEPDEADVAILFGGRFSDPACLGADLFHRKVVHYIAVTGGINRHSGANEAHMLRDVLLERGVPGGRIIIEDSATNTLENVLFLLP